MSNLNDRAWEEAMRAQGARAKEGWDQAWADARQAVESQDLVALIVAAHELKQRVGPRGVRTDVPSSG